MDKKKKKKKKKGKLPRTKKEVLIHCPVDPVRRLSCELPQGRKAARVNGLWRVRGVPRICGSGFIHTHPRSTLKGRMVSFASLGRD